jgi:glutathionyl-hydroquinone reductase
MLLCVLRSDILFLNSTINNGVYRCGFASSQEAYDSAVVILFEALEKVCLASSILSKIKLDRDAFRF